MGLPSLSTNQACSLLTRPRGWRWDASAAASPPPGSGRLLLLARTGEACEGTEAGGGANCTGRWACVAPGVAEARVGGAAVRVVARGREVLGVGGCAGAAPRVDFFGVAVTSEEEEDEEDEVDEDEDEDSDGVPNGQAD